MRLEAASLLLLLSLLHQKLGPCVSLNDEGEGWALLRFKDRVELDPHGALSNWVGGDSNHCSWFGVECSDAGRVVALCLKDLCLKGTLAPELGKLIHIKSLILRNNSFYGAIPKEIGELPILKVLDLGLNKITGPVPSNLGSSLSLEVLTLTSNKFTGEMSPELHRLNLFSELQIDEDLLTSKKGAAKRNVRNATIRKLLQIRDNKGKNHKWWESHRTHTSSPAPSPSPSFTPAKPRPFLVVPPPPDASLPPNSPPPAPSPATPGPSPSPALTNNSTPSLAPPPASSPATDPHYSSEKQATNSTPSHTATDLNAKHRNRTSWLVYASVATGASFLLGFSAIFFLCCRASKVVTVRPWSTGLSGQLRKAFVTGVPALKRSELEVACEDFSNIVGSVSNYMLYKGTLSSGVEIAVTSSEITSAKDWSKECEAQFRKKISVLSKINHKNFVNLLGFCEEGEPFTRMMVFEYAPNGTLFEHLHIREAEHLNWAARLRIAMGVAYCLEHMHQLDPPVILRSLDSSSIYLTDDFAAKLSDLGFWTEDKEVESSPDDSGPLESQVSGPEGIVYRFGILLLEMLSGRRQFSEDNGLLVLWASSYLSGKRPLKDIIDPTLESFGVDQVDVLCDVIRSCINRDPKERPTMSEVVSRLREITAMPPDGAAPKLSPLWWAELEIISAEAT